MPRLKCEQCGVRLVNVLWTRPGSGFTLFFEAQVMSMAGTLSVRTLAARIGESDTRLWRMIHHWVNEARSRHSHASVTSFGVDETASKRRHNYVSVFVDMASRKVLSATADKDTETLARFREDFEAHGGDHDRSARSAATCRLLS